MYKEFFMSSQSNVYKCPKENCDKEYDNIVSLAKHWRRGHAEPSETLYLALNNLTEAPTCACGCKEPTKFLDAGRGYSEYKHGHISRVKNNFVTKKAQENSASTRRKMIKDGTWKPFASKETGEAWNKGLTKESDQRIANMAASISENEEELRKRSQRMKKGRLDGTVPTLYGKDHSQWNGGTSALVNVCRSYPPYYRGWVKVKLQHASFKCTKCDEIKDLHVHHDQETFSDILRKIAVLNKWEKTLSMPVAKNDIKLMKLKMKIADEVADYHINNDVSGVVLCKSCHKKEHDKLNL